MSNLIKVSDIIISQDGCGPYRIVLGGPDASFFRIIDNKLYFNQSLLTTTTVTSTTSTTTSSTTSVPTTVLPMTTTTTATTLIPTPTTSTTANPILAPYGVYEYWDSANSNLLLAFYDPHGFIDYRVQYYYYGTSYPSSTVQQGAKNATWTTASSYSLNSINGEYHEGYVYGFNPPGGFYQFRVAAVINGVVGAYGYSDVLFAGTTTTTTTTTGAPIQPTVIEITSQPQNYRCPYGQIRGCTSSFNISVRLKNGTQIISNNTYVLAYTWEIFDVNGVLERTTSVLSTATSNTISIDTTSQYPYLATKSVRCTVSAGTVSVISNKAFAYPGAIA